MNLDNGTTQCCAWFVSEDREKKIIIEKKNLFELNNGCRKEMLLHFDCSYSVH